MATPLKRVRGLGAAHQRHRDLLAPAPDGGRQYPARHLPHPRSIVTHIGASYDEVHAYLRPAPRRAGVMLALMISAAIHMRIGLKEIIEDYVHGGAKVVAILLATFFAAGVGLASVLAILKISLGS